MNKNILLLISLLIAINHVNAEKIETDSLGSLQLEFESIEKMDHVQAKKIIAKVEVRNGESYVLATPTNVQQISYLVGNGELIDEGQPFAVLRGPEVHHFLSELDAVKALFGLSEQRMKNSKKLFNKKLIEECSKRDIAFLNPHPEFLIIYPNAWELPLQEEAFQNDHILQAQNN